MKRLKDAWRRFQKWVRTLFGKRAPTPIEPEIEVPNTPDPPTGRPLRPDKSRPLGEAGGQGQVYEVVGRPDIAYKRLLQPVHGGHQAYDDIRILGERLAQSLDSKGIFVTWPVEIHAERDNVLGYFMRRIPPQFFAAPRVFSLSTRKEELKLSQIFASNSPQTAPRFRFTREVTDQERIEIVYKVALFLKALHDNDIVYGDVSLNNILFALDPLKICVIDLDPSHNIVGWIEQKDRVATPEWVDPLAEAGYPPRGFDQDRYKFALLAFRLLVANSVSAPLPSDHQSFQWPSLAGLSEPKRLHLERTMQRAVASPLGGRPPIEEWLKILEAPG